MQLTITTYELNATQAYGEIKRADYFKLKLIATYIVSI